MQEINNVGEGGLDLSYYMQESLEFEKNKLTGMMGDIQKKVNTIPGYKNSAAYIADTNRVNDFKGKLESINSVDDCSVLITDAKEGLLAKQFMKHFDPVEISKELDEIIINPELEYSKDANGNVIRKANFPITAKKVVSSMSDGNLTIFDSAGHLINKAIGVPDGGETVENTETILSEEDVEGLDDDAFDWN